MDRLHLYACVCACVSAIVSYIFHWILMESFSCDVKMCFDFGHFWQLWLYQTWIWNSIPKAYFKTPPTSFIRFFWNFTDFLSIVWWCASNFGIFIYYPQGLQISMHKAGVHHCYSFHWTLLELHKFLRYEHGYREDVFFNWKVLIFLLCYEYSLEVPHWGVSNEYPQHVFVEKYLPDTPSYLELCVIEKAISSSHNHFGLAISTNTAYFHTPTPFIISKSSSCDVKLCVWVLNFDLAVF